MSLQRVKDTPSKMSSTRLSLIDKKNIVSESMLHLEEILSDADCGFLTEESAGKMTKKVRNI